jgi:hypothetical protein
MIDIDLESRVAASLHARADRAVPADGLHAAALARARVIRRRRVLGAGVTGLAAVAAVAVAALAVPRPGGEQEPGPVLVQPPQSREADPATLGGLDAPGAAGQPAAVGTDPGALHFDVDLAALDPGAHGLDASEWSSGPGYEGVAFTAIEGAAGSVEISIGSDADALAARADPGPGEWVPTTVDGLSASFLQDERGWVLRWQPVDGLYAIVRVRDADQDLAYAAAGALRLDRAQRCAVPMRLAAVPDGAQWTDCRTALHHRPDEEGGPAWLRSSLTLARPGGDPIEIRAEGLAYAGPADPPVEPNRTVAGYAARWDTDDPAGPRLLVPEFGPASLSVSGATEQEATGLVEGLDMAFTLDRLVTWPPRAVD